jgi:hypothetical protein
MPKGDVMTIAYVVRCNFNDPAREAEWNDWYSGPKLKQMLDKPYFLTGQRFFRCGGTGRDYLAFWTLVSEEAFKTPDYTNDWGFFEWRPYIIDWSRDLFAAENGGVAAPRVGPEQSLRLVSFEGMSAAEAEAARMRVDQAQPGTAWHRSVGLDRHTALFGTSVETGMKTTGVPGVFEVFYRPISTLGITENPAEAALVR